MGPGSDEAASEALALPWLGIASDNGSEFINKHLIRFCEQEEITFSRTRPSRKNDNPYVEQKNYSVVRRAVGYARYEGERELELVNELYDRLRLQINFFKPVMKMVAKQRRGSRIWKKYDVPKLPTGGSASPLRWRTISSGNWPESMRSLIRPSCHGRSVGSRIAFCSN